MIFSSIFVDFVVVGVSPFHMHFRDTFEGGKLGDQNLKLIKVDLEARGT